MGKIQIGDERARKIYEMWIEYAEETGKWKLKSGELVGIIGKKLGKDFLSKQTIYKKLRYLEQLKLIKREEKGRKEVYYELKDNPYTRFKRECLKIEKMAKNYFRLIEEKYKKGKISKEEAIKYAADGYLFIGHVEAKLLTQPPAKEYSTLIHDYASKFINRLAETISSYNIWKDAMDEYIKGIKESIKKKQPRDEEIREYSPVKLLDEMIQSESKKLESEEAKGIFKFKVSTKVKKV